MKKKRETKKRLREERDYWKEVATQTKAALHKLERTINKHIFDGEHEYGRR